ncbi:ABC superfamily ATP binding cassette transporter, binding protein, partial [gut metagenome]
MQQLVEDQVKALIVLPADPYGLTEALAKAKEAGIPVFSYDELIMDSDAVKYYTTFDTREIGQMLGKAIVKEKNLEKAKEESQTYTIEFLMGSPDDTPSLFLYNGLMEVLSPYLE